MTLLAEDDLHAYLDGELDHERRSAVESWLNSDPAQAERLRLWADQKSGLHHLFDPVLDEPVPHRLWLDTISKRQPALTRRLTRLAAALALIALGGLGGWALRGAIPGNPPPVMVSEALSAHRIFVAEIRHPVEVAVAERAHLIGWLSKRLGSALKVPDLEPLGFALMGGRLLPASSGPAAQFMYESKSGQRVTLYLRHTEGSAVTAFRFASQNGIEAFYWLDGPFGYALVGDLPRDQLLPLAKTVYHQIEE